MVATVEDILEGIPAEIQEELITDDNLWNLMQKAIEENTTINAPFTLDKTDSNFPLKYYELSGDIPVIIMVIPKVSLKTSCRTFILGLDSYKTILKQEPLSYYFEESLVIEDLATLLLLPEDAPAPDTVVDPDLIEELIPEFSEEGVKKIITNNYIVYYLIFDEA